MKIKIDIKNKDKIEKLLRECNGKASEHTYNTFEEIQALAKEFERKLISLLPKKSWGGIVMDDTSGYWVSSSYKYSRNATQVVIVRFSSGFFLQSVKQMTIWPQGGDRYYLVSQKQNQEMIEKFLKDNNLEIVEENHDNK